ncbi:MAG: hypothetical protein WC975_11125 [Phycisphaerae bacterium]
MAIEKNKVFQNVKTNPGQKKAPPVKKSEDSSQKNQMILFVVAGILILVAVFMFRYTFRGEGRIPSIPVVPGQPTPTAVYHPSAPVNNPVNPTPAAPAPMVTNVSIKVPEASDEAQAIFANVQEYLRQYDQAVQNGKWSELAEWAGERGLSVEAVRASANSGQSLKIRLRLFDSRLLALTSNNEWVLMTQRKFERAFSKKAPSQDYSYSQIESQINDLPSSMGIANLSRLANLLVQGDCSRGRELYFKAIKEKAFYSILARSVRQAYLSDIKPETAWQSSWIDSVPMNLWLIEQMIAYHPSESDVSQVKKDTPPAGVPGRPGMGPQGALVSATSGGIQNQGLFDHRVMLLQVLARRGGEVSAYLIGTLLEADKEDTLMTGLATGMIDAGMFSRFTEMYAEPLIEPFAKGLARHKVVQQEWNTIACVLARLFNDRASHVVFAEAKDDITLSGDLVFFLASGGTRYTLISLSNFIKASRVQSTDVEKIFFVWTAIPPYERQPLWSVLGRYMPSFGPANKMQPVGPPGAMPGENLLAPGGLPVGPQSGPPIFPRPLVPGGPMPPGMAGPPSMPQFPGLGPQGLPAGKEGRGWPLNRKFTSDVDAPSAIEFLKLLGQLSIAGGKAPANNAGPGPMSPGMPGMDPASAAMSDPARIKIGAVRCLVSLYHPALDDYFRAFLDDPDIGDLCRLGLCTLDDRESCQQILKQFWKNPWELSKPVFTTANNPAQEQVVVCHGNLIVPFDQAGLALYGLSAREALIYFDYREAGKAFLASLGEFVTRKDSFEAPDRVADAACRNIEALGRWSVSGSSVTLADLIESTGDFGLRSDTRDAGQESNPMATRVRMKALEILGKIGDAQSMEIILRIATYRQKDEQLELAAKIALAKRGYTDATDLFLDTIDPEKANKTAGGELTDTTLISTIDPSLKNRTDIALLGLSKIELRDPQVVRVIKLIKKIGMGTEAGQGGPNDLQERLVLGLLEQGQGQLLRGLGELINESPARGSDQNPAGSKQTYYWNRVSGHDLDLTFLKMIRILEQSGKIADEGAVVAFISAILRREEALLVPASQELDLWNPKSSLVNFGNNLPQMPRNMEMMMPTPEDIPPGMKMPSLPLRGMRGEAPPAGPGPMPLTIRTAGSAKLNIPFVPLFGSERMTQEAAISGMNLISHLKERNKFLKEFRDMPFYRYLANFMLWQAGDPDGRVDLVNLLAASTDTPKDKYLLFLAVQQIEQFENLDSVGLLADVIRKNSDSIIRTRMADGALYVTVKAWGNQMAGKAPVLNNLAGVKKAAESFKPIVDSKGYDRQVADPTVITLACLQLYTPVIKWMQDMIRIQCGRGAPVSEQAMGNAVEILRSLNPVGNTALLDLYVSILNQTVDPEKQKLAADLALEKEAKIANAKQSLPLMEDPSVKRSRQRLPHVPNGGTGQRKQGPVPAYQSTAPAIISAISAMSIPEALPALVQAARTRSDLLGFAALEVHKKDKKQGQIMVKQLFVESGKNPVLTEQAKMMISYLKQQPEQFSYDMLGRAIAKSDPLVADFALTLLDEQSKNQKIPPEINLVQLMKTTLQNLISEQRDRPDTGPLLTKTAEFAATLQDKDLNKIVDRVKAMEKTAKQREMRRTRNSPRPRGRSGGPPPRPGPGI